MKYNFDVVHNRLGTYCTQWDFIQDRFGRKDVLPFSISDTDFKAPDEVISRLETLIRSGIYGYTRWNHMDFKGSISSFFQRRHDTYIDPEWILYSPSVLYSISLLIRLLTNPKDKVVTFSPMYDSFFTVIDDNDRVRVDCPLIESNGQFEIDFDTLENQLKEASMFLLCSPHNPTGRIWTKKEMDAMVSLCKKYNVKIVSDEIHMDIQIKDVKHIPLLKYINEHDQLYLLSSASKTFNIPGLIGSYCIFPDKDIREKFLYHTRKVDFLNSVSYPGMIATMAAYTECDDYIDELNEYIKGNLYFVKDYLEKNHPDIHFTISQATYLAWIDIRDVPFTTEQIQDALVNVGKVAIMTGETYGMNKFLRLNCGCPRSKLEEGLSRLTKGLKFLYEGEFHD
ncbi:MAG: MalY/PatB family protein [Floccifex sp.]